MWGFTVKGSWRPNRTEIFWPQTYGRHVVSFLFFWCSTGALGSTLLGAGFLYCILSASSLDPNSSGLPESPFGRVWLSLPHLVSNSTGRNCYCRLELLLALAGTPTQLARRTQLSYIIVRRPLDLWNRMFNCHQAEITVMQFRGHSLPVHHSVVEHWDLHLVPYYQPKSTHAISFDYWPLECVTHATAHHLGIAFLGRVEGEGKLKIQTSSTPIKNWTCVLSCLWWERVR